MSPPEPDADVRAPDSAWLNDRTEYQLNFIHGLRNSAGLQLQYRLEGDRVVTDWTPGPAHVGFPGLVHGGLLAAVLDDVMGRCSVLRRRWVVTGRMDIRYRRGAAIGEVLRAEAWTTRFDRRVMQAQGLITGTDGSVVAEGSGNYLPVPSAMLDRMVQAWPGFAAFVDQEGP